MPIWGGSMTSSILGQPCSNLLVTGWVAVIRVSDWKAENEKLRCWTVTVVTIYRNSNETQQTTTVFCRLQITVYRQQCATLRSSARPKGHIQWIQPWPPPPSSGHANCRFLSGPCTLTVDVASSQRCVRQMRIRSVHRLDLSASLPIPPRHLASGIYYASAFLHAVHINAQLRRETRNVIMLLLANVKHSFLFKSFRVFAASLPAAFASAMERRVSENARWSQTFQNTINRPSSYCSISIAVLPVLCKILSSRHYLVSSEYFLKLTWQQ